MRERHPSLEQSRAGASSSKACAHLGTLAPPALHKETLAIRKSGMATTSVEEEAVQLLGPRWRQSHFHASSDRYAAPPRPWVVKCDDIGVRLPDVDGIVVVPAVRQQAATHLWQVDVRGHRHQANNPTRRRAWPGTIAHHSPPVTSLRVPGLAWSHGLAWSRLLGRQS